eukprot:15463490-Alexandrium_andersonii.AAC.1
MPLRRGPDPLEDRGRVQGELCVGALRKDRRTAGEAHVRREPEEVAGEDGARWELAVGLAARHEGGGQ